MSDHPYRAMPDHQFWRKASGAENPEAFDPVVRTGFKIDSSDRVVTAGSCFAQHVARHLERGGLRHYVTERAHPVLSDELGRAHNYGMFSARYGNVYTARQLRQLLERAYGLFEPMERAWGLPGGCFADPFRPQIQPGGFVSRQELEADRAQHLECVRAAIEGLSVFVFTLGLTEAWRNRGDGAIYPLAPGVAAGDYSPDLYEFVNFGVDETVADLAWSLDFIRQKNPSARFILTVSPVPLNATATDRHVAVATALSKAVLRVAADVVSGKTEDCDYFPSYEIITSPQTGGLYFAEDRREVTERGVEHVMATFLRHYAGQDAGRARDAEPDDLANAAREHVAKMEEIVQVLCDEALLSNEPAPV